MFKISLKNNKSFTCDTETTILNAAKKAGIVLEHSCLTARCRSCSCKVIEGASNKIVEDTILSEEENKNGIILTCNTIPTSDMILDVEDLSDIELQDPRTLPAKIDSIEKITETIIKVVLRLPPSSEFNFQSGQYVNIIKGAIKRSYSIANNIIIANKLEFFIKNYENGFMSNYWFNKAKVNDLLRLEGPFGTFFYRNNRSKDIILLATGTGIAPVKAIVEQMSLNPELCKNKKVWLFWGGRYPEDIFWLPKFKSMNFKFLPVLSRPNEIWEGEKGYVQDIVLKQKINLNNSQVYACGSIDMIASAKLLFTENGLPEQQFYSDAFISTN